MLIIIMRKLSAGRVRPRRVVIVLVVAHLGEVLAPGCFVSPVAGCFFTCCMFSTVLFVYGLLCCYCQLCSVYVFTHRGPGPARGRCLAGLAWILCRGGCSGSGVQWIGVVLYSKLVYNTIQITTPCFHCTPLCRMQMAGD